MSMSSVKVVPIPRVSRRRVEGQLDVISVQCPECREMWECTPSADDKRKNRHPVSNLHECETYDGPLYFLNVAETGKEVVVYGAAEYNSAERASIREKKKKT